MTTDEEEGRRIFRAQPWTADSFVSHANRTGDEITDNSGARCLPTYGRRASRPESRESGWIAGREAGGKTRAASRTFIIVASVAFRQAHLRASHPKSVGATSGLTGCRDGGRMGETYRCKIAYVSCDVACYVHMWEWLSG